MAIKRQSIYKTDTLSVTLCDKGDAGYWLWDTTRQMNLAMRATSERDAHIRALEYYQRRLQSVERELAALKTHVAAFCDAVYEPTEREEKE